MLACSCTACAWCAYLLHHTIADGHLVVHVELNVEVDSGKFVCCCTTCADLAQHANLQQDKELEQQFGAHMSQRRRFPVIHLREKETTGPTQHPAKTNQLQLTAVTTYCVDFGTSPRTCHMYSAVEYAQLTDNETAQFPHGVTVAAYCCMMAGTVLGILESPKQLQQAFMLRVCRTYSLESGLACGWC